MDSPASPVQARLPKLGQALCDYATQLQKAGKIDEALRVLNDVKKMGRALLHEKSPKINDLQISAYIQEDALRREQDMRKSVGSQPEEARMKKEMDRLHYLYLGATTSPNKIESMLIADLIKFFAPILSLASLGLQVWYSLFSLAFFAYLAIRSGGQTASEAHIEATEKVFSVTQLIKLYALTFLPLGVIASLVCMLRSEKVFFVLLALTIAVFVPGILLHRRSACVYKQTYINMDTSGITNPWKGTRIAEKREVSRRLAGIHGGAVVFLLIWGLLVSCGMKVSTGAFPWQLGSIVSKSHTYEERYVQELLAGRVKNVPASWLDYRGDQVMWPD